MNENMPLSGIRGWYTRKDPWRPVSKDNPIMLRSIGHIVEWRAGEVMHARCLHGGERHPEDAAPDPNCECGLYAYDKLATARLYMDQYALGLRGSTIIGVVQLWGGVQVGNVSDDRLSTPGLRFRARHGKALAIRMEDAGSQEVAEELGILRVAERYLESFAREQGEQLRPAA